MFLNRLCRADFVQHLLIDVELKPCFLDLGKVSVLVLFGASYGGRSICLSFLNRLE